MAGSPKSLECVVHLVLILSVISGVASTILKIEYDNKRTISELRLSEPNREGRLPKFPITTDLRRQSGNIVKAHDILRKTLQEFLDFAEADLEIYLNQMIQRDEPYMDEYGKEITLYKKVFSFILEQHQEVMVQNYAVSYFEKDKLDMCSVARYLSHQPSVKERRTLMKRIGDALGYQCHPCTPYKRKQYGETKVPDTDNISPEGVSPEESLIMCNPSKPSPPTTSAPTSRVEPPNTTKVSILPSTETNTTTGNDGDEDEEQTNDPQLQYGVCKHYISKECVTNTDCHWSQRGLVICKNATVTQIKEGFILTSRTYFDTIKLDFAPSDSTTVVPANILANKKTTNLNIVSDSTEDNAVLKIHRNAFRSTKQFTKTIFFFGIDCSELDFSFLIGFEKLVNLTLSNCFYIEISFTTLPLLPSLSILDLTEVQGFQDMETFPILAKGLTYAAFVSREYEAILTDAAVSKILDWILLSSADSLEHLTLERNYHITKMPKQISSFKALNYLNMKKCNIRSIKSGELSFSVPVKTLILLDNLIKDIEPGAFQGDFKDAEINLRGNPIIDFDESVFRPLLQQMISGTGYIDATKNEVLCDDICSVGWLFRDDMRHLLMDKVFVDQCKNDTQHRQLQPNDFINCPGWLT